MALPFHVVEHQHISTADAAEESLTRSVIPCTDHSLELLMRQALDVPGAAAALLEAFAAQSRALRLVQEADARGAALLPVELRQRLAAAVDRTPSWLAASSAGVRG